MMLCSSITEREALQLGKNWICSFKYDGTRAIWDKGKLINRKGTDISFKYPEVIANMPSNDVTLDGEIVILKNGKSNFDLLSFREHTSDSRKIRVYSKMLPATFMAFDIIRVQEKDLKKMELQSRKIILWDFKDKQNNFFKIVPYSANLKKFCEVAMDRNEEGIIFKELNSIYEDRRSNKWLKLKFLKEKEITFSSYERNDDDSITLVEADEGIRVRCSDLRAVAEIERGNKVIGLVEYLSEYENKKLRFPILRELL